MIELSVIAKLLREASKISSSAMKLGEGKVTAIETKRESKDSNCVNF